MSELTRCNYCSHQQTLKDAKAKGMVVTILRARDFGLGGVDEYVHPKSVDIRTMSASERQQYKGAWYMQLPYQCCC